MIHARSDYDRMQDPDGLIGEDEPVMLFRAKDRLMQSALKAYADACEAEGLKEMEMTVRKHLQRVQIWQDEHGCKMPDMPKGAAKL